MCYMYIDVLITRCTGSNKKKISIQVFFPMKLVVAPLLSVSVLLQNPGLSTPQVFQTVDDTPGDVREETNELKRFTQHPNTFLASIIAFLHVWLQLMFEEVQLLCSLVN